MCYSPPFMLFSYCLEILPKSFDEHVVWFCEDCRPKLGKPDTNDESCSPLCEEDDLEITELVQCAKNFKNIPLERLGKKKGNEKWTRDKKKRKKNELKPQTEKDEEGGQLAEKGTVFTSEAEVEKPKNVCLSQVNETQISGNYDKAENIGIDVRATLGDMRNSNEEDEKWTREKKKKKRKKNELNPQMKKDEEGGQLAEKGTVFTSEAEVEKPKNVCLSQVNETQISGNYDEAENIGIDVRATLGDMRNSNEEAESMKAPQSAKLDCPELFGKDTYLYAQPIIDPIWRGSLKFNKQGINYFGKVVAHVSNLACSKVSEEAKLFPLLLSTELHPRLKVWPKGFENWGPSDHSIAIYMFPDNKSEQEFFDSLVVEMIRNDLAMRAVVTNAELLVFTSTKLPLHLWRFQSKFYLWGVFRGKQPSIVSKVDVNMPVSEKDPLKTVTWKTHSPGSPLSVSGSDGSSSVY
ncbi:uncharacterized protein LOC115664325 isoform X2 [Syzygium oleosum]|uniref:uncharacterized protein LOC115664325 isoform X2 n=1 Tax=Syzygium oleosum TaxID=219896 RepID=UPI0024B9A6D7|nr:uncharacterized protein LOC115664325 isoform X2 [Syzygium oleosum]XP_056164266.1 uncharacterized protein LOC115664325 isoform X2 [Syzygium oleosum]